MTKINVLGRLNRNFAWDGIRLYEDADFDVGTARPSQLRGSAASVRRGPGASWRILRDPLGLNKLFWAQADEQLAAGVRRSDCG